MKKLLLCIFLISISFITYSQCTFGNSVGSFDPQNNFDWAQTFTVECDGELKTKALD